MKTILFLCTGNSCRSQMAEGIVNAHYGKEWKAYSAGTKPAGYVHLKVPTALNEIGIAHVGKSKHIDELPTKDFDVVVTVCDDASEECPVWPGKAGKRLHHGFMDPAKAEGTDDEQMAVFRQVRDEMKEFIPTILSE
jgi:arsenate reductase